MKHLFLKYGLSAFLLLLLNACGGSDSGSDTDEGTTPGAMNVTINGLPDSQPASVSVSGPNNYSQSLSASALLSQLSPGSYSFTVNDVEIDNITYSGFDSNVNATVASNATAEVTLSYGAQSQSRGVISAFGSVIVNGITYDSDGAVITTDDTAGGSDDDLALGMQVTVEGLVSDDGEIARADSITYSATARGPVTEINLADASFTLLGLEFLTDELTEFEEAEFSEILVDDWLEVSAILNAEGFLLATRVEKLTAGELSVILRGSVSNLDSDAQTFNLETMLVDYSSAEVSGELAEGAEVKVTADTVPINNELIAATVEVEQEDEFESGQSINLDGIINSFVSVQEFTVNSQAVTTTETTEYEHGAESDLALNVRVKVFGALDENNILVARKIRLDKPGIIKVSGQVEAVDADANSLTVLSINFTTDRHTHMKDKSAAKIKRFGLADLSVGDNVEIKAFEQEAGFVIRLLMRHDSDSSLVELEGQVSSITDTGFVLEGVTVQTNELTEFESGDDEELSQEEFFALLTPDDEIEVKGLMQESGELLAVKVEFEEEDEGQVELKGIIDSFTSAAEFTVNGHNITTDQATTYQGGSESDLALDVMVEVKGIQGESGTILATKIDFDTDEDEDSEVEVKGAISDFVSATEFSINEVSITTDENTTYREGDSEDLAQGVEVEVEGRLQADGSVLADKIEFEDEQETEITGTINNFVSETEFMVGEQAVTTNSATEYKDGDASLLADNMVVEVEGSLDNGVLVAVKIKFEGAEKIELEGSIDSFVSATEFTVNGQAVTTNEFTRFKKGDADDLALGVEIEVKGTLDASNTLVASKITFED